MDTSRTTLALKRARDGDGRAADELMPLVYKELHQRAKALFHDERAKHTLQPTALVHEAYMRLVDQKEMDWRTKTHFFAIAANEMRRALIDHARARDAKKRGGGWAQVALEGLLSKPIADACDILELEEALTELAKLSERQARVVELRFFSGLTIEEVGEVLGVAGKTVEKDWRMARAWLVRRFRDRTEE